MQFLRWQTALEVVGTRHEQYVRVAAILEQLAQAKMTHIADIQIARAVYAIEHLRRSPAIHADVINLHAKRICKMWSPRGKTARVCCHGSVSSGKRIPVTQNARLSARQRVFIGCRRSSVGGHFY